MRRLARLLLAAPAILYVWLGIDFEARQDLKVTGDEPHYLMISDSLVRDFDLKVVNNYQLDAQTRAIFGPVDLHSAHFQYSVHNPGLSIMLAPGFAYRGIMGARVTQALLVGLFPFLLFLAGRRKLTEGWALGVALTLSLAMPFIPACSQLFPDLVTGLAVLGVLLLFQQGPSPRRALLIGVLLALLPWLHLKNVAVGAILGAWWLVELFKHWNRRPPRLVVGAVMLPLFSLLMMGVYNHVAFDNWLGPYQPGAQTTELTKALVIFTGLHFDKVHGMFFQQPLLWLGLLGLASFVREQRSFAVLVALVALSMLVPNAMHTNWYGGWSFAGRFFWSSLPLWIFPLVGILDRLSRAQPGWLGAVLASSLWYQFVLSRTWYPRPGVMYQGPMGAPLWRFPALASINAWLPSFGEFENVFVHRPNGVVLVLAVVVLSLGVALARRGPSGGQLSW